MTTTQEAVLAADAPVSVSPIVALREQPILAIIVCGVIIRILYRCLFLPCWYGDTRTYVDAGDLLAHGYFTDGARTPGYPLFLALARWLWPGHFPDLPFGAALLATALQSILGVVSIVLVYETLRALRVSKKATIAGTAFFAVLHGICQFEMFLLAQSLSLFAVVLGICLFAKTMAGVDRDENPTIRAISTGAAFSFAVLVRPENLVLFLLLALLPGLLWLRSQWLQRENEKSRRLGRVAVLLPMAAAPLLLGWMAWNYIGVGRFQITTLTSWNVNSSVYNLFDRVDPEDRVIGELLSRADLIRNHPEAVPAKERFFVPKVPGQVIQDTYWAVWKQIIDRHAEMPLPPPRTTSTRLGAWIRSLGSTEARKYTHAYAAGAPIHPIPDRDPNEIGDYMASVSWKLIRKYPGAWLHNAFLDFTREGFSFHMGPPPIGDLPDPRSYWDGGVIQNNTLRRLAVWSDRLQAPVLTLLFVLTLGLGSSYPWFVSCWTDRDETCDATAAALALGVTATIAACCLFACYMPHFGVPHWGTIVICGTYAIDRTVRFVADATRARFA